MHKIRLSIVAAVCWAAMQTGAFADSVVPSKVAYHVEPTETARAKVCQLVLDFMNPPDPTVVEFAIVVGWDKAQDAVVTAFTTAVLDLQSPAKDKAPQFTKLASVGFSAQKFNSAGLVQQQSDDKSVWVWTDQDQTRALLEAFLGGDFRIVFAREKDQKLETYHIPQGPTEAIQHQFSDCITTLAPKLADRDGDKKSAAAGAKEPVALLERLLPGRSDRPNDAASKRIMESAPVRERPLP